MTPPLPIPLNGPAQRKREAFVASYLERHHRSRNEQGAVRCGLANASHLCDDIALDIESAMHPSKRRSELAALARACGDAIWAMRERVGVDASEKTDV